ncbi:four helix bundle protein [Wenyingzhuangia marina]|uniref:Four helix bundle protein n=1 Tax=Wenyingzhuangia marina TaxID=1195760 RepID=A0A1M5U6Y5_9FLAO|nr:four helix bundle protein [Wenyingzhuangia marina]GGF69256.1 four helix bundle protein [Wenyingzhuangia marina]SHH58719.1 four helix bundle protein [Wenyingzhuangia marina]
MHNFRELKIWKISKDFCKEVYLVTKSFPKSEIYGLTSQLNRAVVSIPSNIAEGCGRETSKDLARFITIALGSAYEIETQLIIAFELEFIKEEDFETLLFKIKQIQKMLYNFRRTLK